MIIVVDYGMGNILSVSKALEYVSSEEVVVSSSADDLLNASRIVLPGVGSFGDAMKNLQEFGLVEPLKRAVLVDKKPFLGICLGMQILADEGFEHGRNRGLGFVPGIVKRFTFDDKELKIPHVGWNDITFKQKSSLLDGVKINSCFYFVHSFHMVCEDESYILATCNYGYDFVAAIKKGNIFATQFHPEKSQQMGLKILKNFVAWDGD
jgi:glutamine amidotransferase